MTNQCIKNILRKAARLAYPHIGAVAGLIGANLKAPVFIVGTGRCGTTLLVNILDSHPDLLGYPDEANDLWHPRMYPFLTAEIQVQPIEFAPKDFTLRSLDSWPSGQDRTIYNTFTGFSLLHGPARKLFVKSAMISFLMPKILEIFPDARFLHIYRNGPSVVASYVKRNLVKYPEFIEDQDEYRLLCANYWNDCLEEIDRTRSELHLDSRNAFHELSYEHLCDKPAEATAKLAAYLGVNTEGFSYNFDKIESTNHKVLDFEKGTSWDSCIRAMEPSMLSKGYT